MEKKSRPKGAKKKLRYFFLSRKSKFHSFKNLEEILYEKLLLDINPSQHNVFSQKLEHDNFGLPEDDKLGF